MSFLTTVRKELASQDGLAEVKVYNYQKIQFG